jgi:voltage-gated potassium channel
MISSMADDDLTIPDDERWELLQQINDVTEKPLIALSFVWLILLIVDLTSGLNPFLDTLVYIIWALFILDFIIEIVIAPDHVRYLKRNWLTAVALFIPALRVLRIFRAFRVLRAARSLRSINLVRVLTSLNRGMKAASRTLGQRGIGFAIALTIIVLFGGAAGMYYFEGPPAIELGQSSSAAGHFDSYANALWWTAMLVITSDGGFEPVTTSGRVLTLLLAIYGLGVLGYIAGTIASYFVGKKEAEP